MATAKKRIALILPHFYSGGVLTYTKGLAQMLLTASQAAKKAIEIVLYVLDDIYDIEEEFKEVLDLIKIRTFTLQEVTREDVKKIFEFSRQNLTCSSQVINKHKNFMVINDNYKSALDCDFWFIMSDRLDKVIAPLRPYGIMIHDYIQRYVPALLGKNYEESRLATARNAEFVMVTIPDTILDVKNYAGIPPEKIICTGIQFDTSSIKQDFVTNKINQTIKEMNPYAIWPTNTSLHKNINLTLQSLAQYYKEGGKIKVIVTGPYTDELNNQKSIYQELRVTLETLRQHAILKENILFCGNLPRYDFFNILKNAKFLIHPALFDNGNLAKLEAAFFGVPSMSADYPQTRYYDQKFNLHLHFFNQYETNSITEALHYMEKNYSNRTKLLPSPEELLKYSYQSLEPSMILWKAIEKILWKKIE